MYTIFFVCMQIRSSVISKVKFYHFTVRLVLCERQRIVCCASSTTNAFDDDVEWTAEMRMEADTDKSRENMQTKSNGLCAKCNRLNRFMRMHWSDRWFVPPSNRWWSKKQKSMKKIKTLKMTIYPMYVSLNRQWVGRRLNGNGQKYARTEQCLLWMSLIQ